MTYHRSTSMLMGIVVVSCVRPSAYLDVRGFFCIAGRSLSKRSTFWLVDVSRWFTPSLPTFMGIIVCPFVHHIFKSPCICWQITWKDLHKIWHADVNRLHTVGRHRCQWVLLSFSCVRPPVRLIVHELGFWFCGQIAWKKKFTFWHADVSRKLTLSLSTLMAVIIHLSVRPAILVWFWMG